MKVVLIADSDPRGPVMGGIGVYTKALAHELVKHGVDVAFLGKKHNTQKHKVPFDYYDVTDVADESNMSFLRKLWRFSFDSDVIVHAQRPDWILPFLQYKSVVTLHGSHAKNVALKKSGLTSMVYNSIERKALLNANKIISVSDENTQYYHAQYDIDISTIPVGIHLPKKVHFDQSKIFKKYNVKPGKYVLYVGRLEAEKQVEVLIKSCATAKYGLLIAGDGRERSKLEKVAKGTDTYFLGAINHADLGELFSISECLGLSSLYEGLPTVILESFSYGVPVVATPVGDIPRVLVPGTGVLATKERFSEAILRVDKALMRKNCLNEAKKYSWNTITKKIIEVYSCL